MSKEKKTASISFDTVKCTDGWRDLGSELGFSYEKIQEIFEYGEYGSFEIIVDEDLNIIGGHIIPCGRKNGKRI